MKATVTRTLQVPQFAPVVISLEKECNDDDYDVTMDFLADAIENKLRERYPDFAIVLPDTSKKKVEQRQVENVGVINKEQSVPPKLINHEIENAETLEDLKSYEFFVNQPQNKYFLAMYNKRFEELSK